MWINNLLLQAWSRTHDLPDQASPSVDACRCVVCATISELEHILDKTQPNFVFLFPLHDSKKPCSGSSGDSKRGRSLTGTVFVSGSTLLAARLILHLPTTTLNAERSPLYFLLSDW